MKKCSLMIVLGLTTLLSGCSKDPQKAIIGKWEAADGPSYSLEFGSDGTMKFSKDGQELKVLGKPPITKYRFTDKNSVEAGDESNPGQFKFSVRVEGTQLVVSGEGDSAIGGIGKSGKWESFPPKKGEQQKFNRKQ